MSLPRTFADVPRFPAPVQSSEHRDCAQTHRIIALHARRDSSTHPGIITPSLFHIVEDAGLWYVLPAQHSYEGIVLMRNRWQVIVVLLVAVAWQGIAQGGEIPRQVPARRSTQLRDGFGMNQSLPREPHLPWSQRWWTRLFDSGVKWVRLGQYENSSDMTSWDWVEQTPGHFRHHAGARRSGSVADGERRGD